MSFESLQLSNPLLNALADLEYVYPTPIQIESYPIIMSGIDVVGIAQTGTGKTFAYLLPILRQLRYSEQREPRVLILVPSRELVLQVMDEIKKLTVYMSVRVAGVYGGGNIQTQKDAIYKGIDILVATPGRLVDLVLDGILKTKSITKLVIDEVDMMLSLGFRPQIRNILETLIPRRQNLMFSATLSPDVEYIIEEYFIQPRKIEIAAHGTPIERISQYAYVVPNMATKFHLLDNLLQTDEDMSKVLIFVNNKHIAEKIQERLHALFPDIVGVTHSHKTHNQRIAALQKFKDGDYRILVATDIIARGLDISDVTHVVNFDIPAISGDYIHRIGRTGRANKDGVAISLVSEFELERVANIEALMNKKIARNPLPQNVAISHVLTDEELKYKAFNKDYLKSKPLQKSQGAFHEKKEKNKKVNLGGLKQKARREGQKKRK